MQKNIICGALIILLLNSCITIGSLFIYDRDLIDALEGGDLEFVQKAINSGINMNTPISGSDDLPLSHAAECSAGNSVEMIKLLLDNGADPNARDTDVFGDGSAWDPLDHAVNYSIDRNVAALIDGGAALDKNNRGEVLLFNACVDGHEQTVTSILNRGADPDIYMLEAEYTYAVSAAAAKGYNKILTMLLEHGFYPNFQDRKGNTPLYYAVTEGNAAAVEVLMKHGADSELANNFNYTPLFYAIDEEDPGKVAALVENGADTNSLNPNGESPLYCALDEQFAEGIALLIDHGADVNFKYEERALIFKALSSHNYEAVALLVRAGVDPATMDGDGVPLLSLVADTSSETNIVALEALLEAGADPNLKNYFDERRPLLYAIEEGNLAAVRLLIDRGAVVNFSADISNYTTKKIHTPLTFAVKNGEVEIARLLLQKGADPAVTMTERRDVMTIREIAEDERDIEMIKMLEEFGL